MMFSAVFTFCCRISWSLVSVADSDAHAQWKSLALVKSEIFLVSSDMFTDRWTLSLPESHGGAVVSDCWTDTSPLTAPPPLCMTSRSCYHLQTQWCSLSWALQSNHASYRHTCHFFDGIIPNLHTHFHHTVVIRNAFLLLCSSIACKRYIS